MTSPVINPYREVPTNEVSALITIEVAERLARRAVFLLDEAEVPDQVTEAVRLLLALIDETSTRTCTAVKRQALSDTISQAARARVARVVG